MLVPNIENFSNYVVSGNSALDNTYTVENNDIRIISLDFTFNTSVDNTDLFELNLVSARTNPATTVLVYSRNLSGVTSLIYTPDSSILAEVNDSIHLTWDNSTGIGYIITVNYVNRFSIWRMDTTWR